MSQGVSNAMQVKFRNDVELVLQQTKSVLDPAVVDHDDTSNEKVKIKDLVGNTKPIRGGERHGDTRYNERSYDGVWVAKGDELYDADLVDNDDKLGTTLDLQGTVVQSCGATIARSRDIIALEGFYNPIVSGKTGTVVTPFPSGNILPVTTGGASGAQKMNVAKIRKANTFLQQNYVDMNMPRYMVMTAEDNDALMTEVPVTSMDYARSHGVQYDEAAGRIMGILGFTFLYLELDNPMLDTIPALATDGSGYRRTPFWVKGGLIRNNWQRLRTMLDVLPGKRGSVQYYAGTTATASRTQPGMSGIILNNKG